MSKRVNIESLKELFPAAGHFLVVLRVVQLAQKYDSQTIQHIHSNGQEIEMMEWELSEELELSAYKSNYVLMLRSPGEAINTSRFRSSTSNRISRAMSPHSGGGEGKHLTLKLTGTIILSPHCRLSNENVSSVYDDRLDKVDPEGTLQPRQRRWASGHVIITMCHTVTISSHGPGGVAAICIQTRSSTHL